MVIVTLLLLCLCTFVLVKSSDKFVEAASRIAKYFGVSEFVIGLTIVAIGTSLPELASSVTASFAGTTELAVGTVIGSNIANIGLLIGLSALAMTIHMSRKAFLRDCSVMVWVASLFYFLSLDGSISRLEGLLLLALLPAYAAMLLRFRPKLGKNLYDLKGYVIKMYTHSHRHLRKITDIRKYPQLVSKATSMETYKSKFGEGIAKDVILLAAACFMIYISAKYLVQFAVELALFMGVTNNVIGATLIAVGTSLPELSVSISSIRKGYVNILVGNIVGSNIFNILLVAGTASLIAPLNILASTIFVSLPFMMLMAVALFAYTALDKKLGKLSGAALIGMYSVFVYMIVNIGRI